MKYLYKCRDCNHGAEDEDLTWPDEDVEPSCPKCGHYNAMIAVFADEVSS